EPLGFGDQVHIETIRAHGAYRQARTVQRDEALGQDVFHPALGYLDAQVELLTHEAVRHHTPGTDHVAEPVGAAEFVTHATGALHADLAAPFQLVERGQALGLHNRLETD